MPSKTRPRVAKRRGPVRNHHHEGLDTGQLPGVLQRSLRDSKKSSRQSERRRDTRSCTVYIQHPPTEPTIDFSPSTIVRDDCNERKEWLEYAVDRYFLEGLRTKFILDLKRVVAHIIEKDSSLLGMSPSEAMEYVCGTLEFKSLYRGQEADIKAWVEDFVPSEIRHKLESPSAELGGEEWVALRQIEGLVTGKKLQQMVIGNLH